MNGNSTSAESLADMIEQVLANKDLVKKLHHGPARQRLRDAASRLSTTMETQADSINRIRDTPLQLAMAKVGIDKNVFEILAAAPEGKGYTNAELAEKTGIDPNLLKRILRYLQSIGTIYQPENDSFVANNVTEALASVQGRTALTHNMITMAPVFLALPEFFQKNGYKPIQDILDTPFQLAHRTKLDPWAWGQEKPERYEAFLAWMMHARDNLPVFVDVLDIGELFGPASDPDTVLFVDVGGSRGPITTKVRQKYASVPGRVVLQDQDYVIAAAKKEPLPGFDKIETQVIDFFTHPNPLKGARVYYLRNILHDWSDEKCIEILSNVKPAMVAGQSVLLVDELVLPPKQAPMRESQLDIEMFTHLSGAERTEQEWRDLLGKAGFEVRAIRRYGDDRHDSVIEAILK